MLMVSTALKFIIAEIGVLVIVSLWVKSQSQGTWFDLGRFYTTLSGTVLIGISVFALDSPLIYFIIGVVLVFVGIATTIFETYF